jgi:aminopeptidase N
MHFKKYDFNLLKNCFFKNKIEIFFFLMKIPVSSRSPWLPFFVGVIFQLVFLGCKTNQDASQNIQNQALTAQKDKTAAADSTFLVPIEEDVKVETEPDWRPKKGDFHPAHTQLWQLVHTKLEIRPDWQKQWLYGKATLTLTPHFYAQKSLNLDAIGFEIRKVSLLENMQNKNISYDYDGKVLRLNLEKSYEKGQNINIEIVYIAKPNEALYPDSQAGNSAKEEGLFFINPLNKTPNKPQQIWTQGETSHNALWFPTLNHPNYKMTQEIALTVENRFQTLSNGILVASQNNADGTRTDFWKQSKPHAPYLTMIAVGEFEIIEDKYKDLPLYYYVEKPYRPYARAIFGKTPEMIKFYEKLLGVPFPWEKYAQIVVRDYTSGAMENTSASVFMEALYSDTRALADHHWEGIISHELFHQWFGDLVTCRSWSNLAVNEAFAEYGEYLWEEHARGRKFADYKLLNDFKSYFYETAFKREPIVRPYYISEDDMFDNHSYAKGGIVLNMLRRQVGDAAFFASLQHFLKKHAFQAAEMHDFRRAVEEVSGQDLTWFFEQWFFQAGHPELLVQKSYENKKLILKITQTQDTRYFPIFRLPLSLDIWVDGKKRSQEILLSQASQVFDFQVDSEPELVVLDPDGWLLGEVKFEKSAAQYRLQAQRYQAQFLTQLEAIKELAKSVEEAPTRAVLYELLQSDFWAVREAALRSLGEYRGEKAANEAEKVAEFEKIKTTLQSVALQDVNSSVRASAVDVVSFFGEMPDFWEKTLKDSSYYVQSVTLYALINAYGFGALYYVEQFEQVKERHLTYTVAEYYASFGIEGKYEWFVSVLDRTSGSELSYLLNHFTQYLANQPEAVLHLGVDYLLNLAQTHSYFQIRKDAYQALAVLSRFEGVTEKMQVLKTTEKDKRVLEFQQAIGI